jgi:hypothetical protein
LNADAGRRGRCEAIIPQAQALKPGQLPRLMCGRLDYFASPRHSVALLTYFISSYQDALIYYLHNRKLSANFVPVNLPKTDAGQNRTSPTPVARAHRHH